MATRQEIEKKLAQLKAAIAAKRAEKEDVVKTVQETQRKQARYGRDTEQIRPPKAGYATESEKLMGGGTGYYPQKRIENRIKELERLLSFQDTSGLGSFGATAEQVSIVTDEVSRLTSVVKQLSKDVAAGVAPRSELVKAAKDLQIKMMEAQEMTSQLSSGLGSGWTDASSPKLLIIGGLLLGSYLVFKCCFRV